MVRSRLSEVPLGVLLNRNLNYISIITLSISLGGIFNH